MGTPRFTPEFKEEAVRQITERGYSVAEVSDRLGVSAHSLYKWLRAIKPDNSEQYARAGFYAWLHNPVSARDKDNQRLLTLIRDSYSLSGGVYGYRRVHGDLNEIGETCGKNRVGRVMQLNRIKVVRGYKAARRIAGRPSVVAPDRVQWQFTVVRANQVWVTDITDIRTWQCWLARLRWGCPSGIY